jgi:hypothetical protein
MIGKLFIVTTSEGTGKPYIYQVLRPHRDKGFYECVCKSGGAVSRHGSIQVYSHSTISNNEVEITFPHVLDKAFPIEYNGALDDMAPHTIISFYPNTQTSYPFFVEAKYEGKTLMGFWELTLSDATRTQREFMGMLKNRAASLGVTGFEKYKEG